MSLDMRMPSGQNQMAHSERGCQYASHAYRARLEEMGWLSSMTERLHCYENAKAERLGAERDPSITAQRGIPRTQQAMQTTK